VLLSSPRAFVLENVPILRNDPTYRDLLDSLRTEYGIVDTIVSYGDWGAATLRRRLFAIGLRGASDGDAAELLTHLNERRTAGKTIGEAFADAGISDGVVLPDHDWPSYRTIDKYADKYATSKFGWYRLNRHAPAPSFGNVGKTYVLHPDAVPTRVVSPREIMAILGFSSATRFPPTVPRSAKYRMVADAVSPVFSRVLAEVLRESLTSRHHRRKIRRLLPVNASITRADPRYVATGQE
jgi:DNA (cytosine-5)-methyltransferase 1